MQEEEEEAEEEAAWFQGGRDSLIFPRKAQRSWRKTGRTKLTNRGLQTLQGYVISNHIENNEKTVKAVNMQHALKWESICEYYSFVTTGYPVIICF